MKVINVSQIWSYHPGERLRFGAIPNSIGNRKFLLRFIMKTKLVGSRARLEGGVESPLSSFLLCPSPLIKGHWLSHVGKKLPSGRTFWHTHSQCECPVHTSWVRSLSKLKMLDQLARFVYPVPSTAQVWATQTVENQGDAPGTLCMGTRLLSGGRSGQLRDRLLGESHGLAGSWRWSQRTKLHQRLLCAAKKAEAKHWEESQ